MKPEDLRNPGCPSCYLLAAWEKAAGPQSFVELGGKFAVVNQAWADMFAREKWEFQSLTWPEITHPDDVGIDSHEVERLKRGEGLPYYDLDKRYRRKSGEYFPIRLRVNLVPKDSGEPWFFWVSAIPLADLEENRGGLVKAGFGPEVYQRAAAEIFSGIQMIREARLGGAGALGLEGDGEC